MLAPIYCSLVCTSLAVSYGLAAYFAERRSSRVEAWEAVERDKPMGQADRLRAAGRRIDERAKARAFTLFSGGWWLSGGLFATFASMPENWLAGLAAGGLTLITATVVAMDSYHRRIETVDFARRAKALDDLNDRALDPSRAALSVDDQLIEWAANSDLLVFIQHKLDGPPSTTYQGRLVLQRAGVGGWILQAPDWHVGPLDSVSNVRGIALNLHHFTENRWVPGNGTFGASCWFHRRTPTLQRAPDDQIVQTNAIVEALYIRIDDPFEFMPFMEPTSTA